MNKFFFVIGLVTASSFAYQPEFSGYLWTNLWTNWVINEEDQFDKPDNYVNSELSIEANFPIDEGFSVSAKLMANTHDAEGGTAIPYGKAKASNWHRNMDDPYFDTYAINWEVAENGTLSFGQFLYSFGTMDNYYPYSYSVDYSAIIANRKVFGLGVFAGGFEVYFGIPDTKNRSMTFHVNYPIEISRTTNSTVEVHPMMEYTTNQGRNRNFILGTTYHVSQGNSEYERAFDGTFAMLPYKGQTSYTTLNEFSLRAGAFTLGMGYYHAFLANDTVSAALQTDVPDKQFAYIEPMIEIGSMVGLGIPFSWHNASDQKADDQTWLGGVNVYLYPTKWANIKFFGNYILHENQFQSFSSGGDSFMTGIEARVDF